MVLERDVRLAVQRPKILVTRRLPKAVEERMAALFEARFNRDDAPFSAIRFTTRPWLPRREVRAPA